MNEPMFFVTECNALGRAVPKLWRETLRTKTSTPLWDEKYHVANACALKLSELRRRVIEESAPWFDNSAFTLDDPLPTDSVLLQHADDMRHALELDRYDRSR